MAENLEHSFSVPYYSDSSIKMKAADIDGEEESVISAKKGVMRLPRRQRENNGGNNNNGVARAKKAKAWRKRKNSGI